MLSGRRTIQFAPESSEGVTANRPIGGGCDRVSGHQAVPTGSRHQSRNRADCVWEQDQLCPAIWSLLIGECIHNLRSALDHMVWISLSGTADCRRPPTRVSSRFLGRRLAITERSKHLLKGVGSRSRRLRGCNRSAHGRTNEFDSGIILDELFNWDKHRSLRLTGGHLHAYETLELGQSVDAGLLSQLEVRRPGSFEQNTVFAAWQHSQAAGMNPAPMWRWVPTVLFGGYRSIRLVPYQEP